MNENSRLRLPNIGQWLRRATVELKEVGIPSPRLDAEIILAHTVHKSRTYLHAHSAEQLTPHQYEIANARLDVRRDRTPIAYIIGHKEFYGRRFRVTPATLTPRPESEDIISLLKDSIIHSLPLLQHAIVRLVDVGTGTGCLGITAKLEFPEIEVSLVDISQHALHVAQSNAHLLGAEVTITRSDLLTDYPFTADYILANLPYVDRTWERSPETDHEPAQALFAESGGLALILKFLGQISPKLRDGGLVLLEADPRQHEQIIPLAKSHGLTLQEVRGFVLCLRKG